ncbi:MAG: hypothetical protein M3041_12670 [Acidobacteriota bacterium]|nr:hypothetical protein [Acidobacteriota bacterium]
MSFFRQLSLFAYFAGFAQSNQILRQLVTVPVVTAVVFLLAWFSFWKFQLGEKHFGVDRPVAFRRMLFALTLAFLAIAPYAAVGKAPAVIHGPNTRSELLLGVPAACLIVWSIILLFGVTDGLSRPAFLTLMIVLSAFTLETLRTYVAWQAEWARERAIIFSLAQHREGSQFATLWFCVDGLDGDPYFITGIDALLLEAWGRDSGVFIDPAWNSAELASRHPDEFQHPSRVFVLPNEIPARAIEPQGTVAICISHGSSDLEVAAKYLLNRLLRLDRQPSLFQDLVSVDVRPGSLSGQASRRCCP